MQTEIIKTRICIVGAGPAGATASIFLGKMGIEHVLIDAADFPRDKICGDGLDLNVIRVLNHIDPLIVEKELMADGVNFSQSKGFRLIAPNGKYANLERMPTDKQNGLADKPIFFVSTRTNFDNLLVNKIDHKVAKTFFATRVNKITKNGNTWHLEGKGPKGKIEIEADFLIGADGDHSVVLKHLGIRKIDRSNYAGAVRQYWQGVEGTHKENLLEVYFPKRLPLSYFWIFPLPDGKANVGYGMASNYIAKHNINVRKEFEELIKSDPVLMKRFKNAKPLETVKGWGIPMSGSKRKAHGDGYLLLGDAASIVCPTSGEGIGSGMLSGYVAAKFLQRALQQNDLGEKMFANYYREIHKRFLADEKMYRVVNNIPGWAFSWGLNKVLSNRLFANWATKRAMNKWVDTAYNKEITVNFE